MSKLICLGIVCCLPVAVVQARQSSADEYVTGMTVLGRPGADSSCPPIVWVVELDTPAAKAGIQPGDRVLAVDGHRGIDIVQARPLLRTNNPKPSTIELEGQRGLYTVSVGRIQQSILNEREGFKQGPDGGWYPKNATEAEMQRVSKFKETSAIEKVFPISHYPANLELHYPGFEIWVWKEPQPMTVGGIEHGPAWNAGVHFGDTIISVNGVNPHGKSVAELEQLFSSPTPVTMTLVIDRDGAIKTFSFELAKASDVALANHKRMYEGKMIPSVGPPAYLHCW